MKNSIGLVHVFSQSASVGMANIKIVYIHELCQSSRYKMNPDRKLVGTH